MTSSESRVFPTMNRTLCVAILALMVVFPSSVSRGAVDDRTAAERCNHVIDEADEKRRMHGESDAARELHSNIVGSGTSLTPDCRSNLVDLLGKSCERLEGGELYSCVELLSEAVSAANISLEDRWQFQVQVLFKAFKQHRQDKQTTAAERTLEELRRLIARSPEPVKSDLLRTLLFEEGAFYFETDRLKEAEGSYSELLTMCRRSDDPDPSDLVFPLRQLAAVCEAQGRLRDSRAYLEQAISVVEAQMGRDSPALVLILEQYARVLNRLGEKELAASSSARADRLR